MTEEQTVRSICRNIRAKYKIIAMKSKWGFSGYCCEASDDIFSTLRKIGIESKIRSGLFWIDIDYAGREHKNHHGEAHTWVEWNRKPIDVTATQFNSFLFKKVESIIFGTHLNRYRDFCGRKWYK
jgi:hypothetical protein